MERNYKYDAFISYRHLSPDKPIAEKLQKLLEAYSAPKGVLKNGEKRKLHLFRDETELPTSNDLGGDILRALEQSRFLIVICSERFTESKWCMQEVAYFQKLHGGSNRQILTLFVGDPDVPPSFPDPLRYEKMAVRLPGGDETFVRKEIEPLAANVSAKTLKQSLKKLKVEFLRIAAPLLRCGFDDLYQREQRRRIRRKFSLAMAAAAALALVLMFSVISIQQRKRIQLNYTESLINQSKTLESSGDPYDALNTVMQTLPKSGRGSFISNRSVEQAASLTGAYEPEIFTATRKISFSSDIVSFCLMNGGNRLFACLENDEASLWDTGTGEQLCVFDAASKKSLLYYHSAEIEGDFSVERYAKSFVSVEPVGNRGLICSRYKAVKDEKNKEEDAIFYINEEGKTLQRISPYTGSAIWSKEGDYSFVNNTTTLKNKDAFPVLITETVPKDDSYSSKKESICCMDFDSGEEIARISYDTLEKLIEDFNDFDLKSVNYVKSYVLINYGTDLYVFKVRNKETRFLYRIPDFIEYKYTQNPIKDSNIFGKTLMLLGNDNEGLPNEFTFFYGYDLTTGTRKWAFVQKVAASSESTLYDNKAHIGLFRPAEETGNSVKKAFAVIDCYVYVVDPKTGKDLGSFTLVDVARDMYYSENGLVFVIDSQGREILFSVNDDIAFSNQSYSDVYYMVKNRTFETEINKASYCNNNYALIRDGHPNEAVIYSIVKNDQITDIYHTEEKDMIYYPAANSELTLIAAEDLSNYETNVIDVESGNVICAIKHEDSIESMSFWDNETLALCFGKAIELYNALTGDLIEKYEFNGSDDKFVLLNDSREILNESEGVFTIMRPGEETKTIFDLNEYLQQKSAGEGLSDSSSLYVFGYLVSPSGGKIAVFFKDGSWREYETHALIFDRKTGATVEIDAPDISLFPDILGSAWSLNEDALFLLTGKEIFGFRCKSGKTIFAVQNQKHFLSMCMMEDTLCVLDNVGTLRILKTYDGIVESDKSILLNQGSSSQLSYLPISGQYGFLDRNNMTWIIDRKKFEIVCCLYNSFGSVIEPSGMTKRFIGYDPETNLIYMTHFDKIYAYPLLSAYELRQRADSIIH